MGSLPEIFLKDGALDMTHLALNLSHYVNGVAKRHGQVSRQMFSLESVDAITNGVHATTWTSEPFARLFDKHLSDWRQDNFTLRYALSLPAEEVWAAHQEAKGKLLERVKRETGVEMKPEVLTIGFARRATGYKRMNLLFHDLERLKRIAAKGGGLQVVYAGKAHPHDDPGKEMIKQIFHLAGQLKPQIPVVYLADYGMELGKLMTSGVDVWLNTPQPPLEASGTSGMKAALNGVPSLSILDGWWLEGHIEGVTGWSIGMQAHGTDAEAEERTARDADSLYQKLEEVVIPLFYRHREHFITVMRQAIAFNGSFFHTQRMVQEYVLRAYFR
jgi:starch phosphorylase